MDFEVEKIARTVKFNQAQWKAAHNSVERSETIFEQLDPNDGKCGGIELDFVVDPTSVNILNTKEEAEKLTETEKEKYEGWRFAVQHGEKYDSKNAPMHDVLRSLRKWSKEHEGHDVVTIFLDLKGGGAYYGDHHHFVSQLDGAIDWGLGSDIIFAPKDLQKDASSLLEGARKYGWPSLEQLQNKFILVISGSDTDKPVRERRDIYCETDPHLRLCFVDIDQRGCNPKKENCNIHHPHYNKGDRVFVNIQLGNNHWSQLGRDAGNNGFVTRVWKANKQADWDEAKRAQINFIATDKIRHYKWAAVSPSCESNFVVL